MSKVKKLNVIEITPKIFKKIDAGIGEQIDLIIIPIQLKEKWLGSDLRLALIPCLYRKNFELEVGRELYVL